MSGTAPTFDPLTGAFTRTTLMPSLQAAIEAARADSTPLAVLIIDLDYFKIINDTFGHLRGDEVLVELAERLRTMGEGHDLFRYGGDEFVLILRRTAHELAHRFGEQLCHAVRALPFGSERPLNLSLTVGCASLQDDVQTAQALFERADRRLLAAKRAGRNRIISDDEWATTAGGSAAVQRLVEREPAFESLHTFLNELSVQRRGQLTISGPPGVGRSAFLAEVHRRAQVHGFMVLPLRGSAGLRMRDYGALHEALPNWPALPFPFGSTELWIDSLRTTLEEQHRGGIIFAVDDVQEFDQATVDLIRESLRSTHDLVVGVIFTISQATHRRSHAAITRYSVELELAPLSRSGVGVWLRSVLGWESPARFQAWLYEQTRGLPARLSHSIAELASQHILTRDSTGWSLHPDYASRTISDRLAELCRPRPHNLPTPATPLVGRAAEIGRIKSSLAPGGPVTLVGPGGIGKTRLAQQVAAEMVEHFQDGARFVPLADISSAEQMVYTIASVLQVPLTAQKSPQQQLIDALHDRELLLLVDNLEHIQGGGAILQAIAVQAPTVSLLLTSREPTGVVGETVIELEGLSTQPLPAKPDIEDSSAVRLFMHIAEQRGHKLDPADLHAASEICHLVEGMPLGIELAGAWIELFTCREIADQLARNYDILSKTPQGLQHGSLRAVFDYFWRQLSSDEQRVVRRLGVFRGGFELEAASTIAGASPFLLAGLVDKAFLARTNAGRYNLHKLLQQYADRQLASWPDDRQAVLLEHAHYYCTLAERAEAEIHGVNQTKWLDRLAAEHDNIRISLASALDSGRIEYGLQLIKHLGHYWRVRGHCSEGRTWIDQFLARCPESMPERVGALRWAGILAQEQGDYVPARGFLIDYLAIARAHADDSSIADALGYLGWIASVQGEYDQAQVFLKEGLDLVRELDEPITLLHILNNLGEVTHRQGNTAQSKTYYTEALARARSLGDRREIGESLLGLGNACSSEGNYAEAEKIYAECLEHARAINDRRRIGESLGNLGLMAYRREAFQEAQECLLECLTCFEAIGNQFDTSIAYAELGNVSLALHDVPVAQRYFRDALQLAYTIGALPIVLEALAGLASIRIREGEPEQAYRRLAFIATHPSCSRGLRSFISPLLDSLDREHGGAQQETQRLTVEGLVAEVLGSATTGTDTVIPAPIDHVMTIP